MRCACALPTDQEPAGEGGVAKAVADVAQCHPGVAVAHPFAGERGLEAVGELLGHGARLAGRGQARERE